jgi:uncharacterized membrane protein YidH (DUF202 family)
MPTEGLSHAVVIASIDRAGDHAAVVGVLLVAVAIVGLVYGAVRFAARSRAGRTRPKSDRTPEA